MELNHFHKRVDVLEEHFLLVSLSLCLKTLQVKTKSKIDQEWLQTPADTAVTLSADLNWLGLRLQITLPPNLIMTA